MFSYADKISEFLAKLTVDKFETKGKFPKLFHNLVLGGKLTIGTGAFA